jgi:hypothetical protein
VGRTWPQAKAQSKVYRINPNSTSIFLTDADVWATGFHPITGCGFGLDAFYVTNSLPQPEAFGQLFRSFRDGKLRVCACVIIHIARQLQDASESTATATNAAACAARGVNSMGARWLCYRYLRRIAQSWIIAVCVSTINYLPTSLGRSRRYKITSVRRSRHTAGWCTRVTIVHCTISKK